MNKFLVFVCASLLVASPALAQEKKDCGGNYQVTQKSSCSKDGNAKSCGGSGQQTASACDMPKMAYMVGDKQYTDRGEAMDAYAVLLDGYLASMTTVKPAGEAKASCTAEQKAACTTDQKASSGEKKACCTSGQNAKADSKDLAGKYVLASYTFDCKEKAEKAAAAARAAADKVSMKMVVGEKSFECPMSAAECAKSDGKPVQYVVGEAKTGCNKTAKVELAKAKINAAAQAIEKTMDGSLAHAG